MMTKKKNEISIHSSAAEYLTYVASIGDNVDSMEMRYEDENIWLTQRMMAQLYDVSLPTINEHIKKIYSDGELIEEATIRKFRIVQTEGIRQVKREVIFSAEQAKLHAETEFEKYRNVQDQIFMSDYDKFLLELEESAKK